VRAQDDCCQGEASTSSQAVMYNAVKAIDPWHIIIGALQCMQEFWQWSDYPSFLEPAAATPTATIPVGVQPKLQLSLDLIMRENYHEFNWPPGWGGVVPGELRRGMAFEPIVNCYGLWNNGPGASARVTPQSAAASRSMLWLSVLRTDTPMQLTFMLNTNSWAQPEQRGDGGWLQTIAVPQFQAEVKLLAPSLLPVFGSAVMDLRPPRELAAVTVEAAVILEPNSAPPPPSITPRQTAGFPVVARGWSEECESSSFYSKQIPVSHPHRYITYQCSHSTCLIIVSFC
jgi:hypothetical protein